MKKNSHIGSPSCSMMQPIISSQPTDVNMMTGKSCRQLKFKTQSMNLQSADLIPTSDFESP